MVGGGFALLFVIVRTFARMPCCGGTFGWDDWGILVTMVLQLRPAVGTALTKTDTRTTSNRSVGCACPRRPRQRYLDCAIRKHNKNLTHLLLRRGLVFISNRLDEDLDLAVLSTHLSEPHVSAIGMGGYCLLRRIYSRNNLGFDIPMQAAQPCVDSLG